MLDESGKGRLPDKLLALRVAANSSHSCARGVGSTHPGGRKRVDLPKLCQMIIHIGKDVFLLCHIFME